jgi:hypothetical protein
LDLQLNGKRALVTGSSPLARYITGIDLRIDGGAIPAL